MLDANQPRRSEFRVIWSENLEWQILAAFPPAARLAVLVGDPTQPDPYVIRVRLPAGGRVKPHALSQDRIYTVISGIFYIGLGEKYDETQLTAHAPGSVLVVPAGQSHFHWAKSGEYVVQVHGMGPVQLTYVSPADDPRHW